MFILIDGCKNKKSVYTTLERLQQVGMPSEHERFDLFEVIGGGEISEEEMNVFRRFSKLCYMTGMMNFNDALKEAVRVSKGS